ncbi:hypothetical protein GCM10027082_09030 [Comamonas humi]
MKKPWVIAVLFSLAQGLVLGAALMWIAWQTNAQCEIHCAELGIDWGYWLALGAAGLVIGFGLGMVLAAVVIVAAGWLRR